MRRARFLCTGSLVLIVLTAAVFWFGVAVAYGAEEFYPYCAEFYNDTEAGSHKPFSDIGDYLRQTDEDGEQRSILQLEWPKVGPKGNNDLGAIADRTDGNNIALGEIVTFFYNVCLWLGILGAFLSLLYAGFAFMMSAQNPSLRKEAQDRLRNIFMGIIILLCVALILNFTGLNVTSDDCEEGDTRLHCRVVESSVDCTTDASDPSLNCIDVPRAEDSTTPRLLNNEYQRGIPFSSAESFIDSEKHQQIQRPSTQHCRLCNGEILVDKEESDTPPGICNVSCSEESIQANKKVNLSEEDMDDDDDSSRNNDDDSSRIVGLDKLKCYYDVQSEEENAPYKSWAVVAESDDNAILSCVAACAVIARHNGEEEFTCPSKYSSADEFGREYARMSESELEEIIDVCSEDENFTFLLIDTGFKIGTDVDEDCVDGYVGNRALDYEGLAPGDKGYKSIRDFVEDTLGKNGENVKSVDTWQDIEDSDWYDGKLLNYRNGWIFWGSDGSPDKGTIKIHDEDDISRAKLRACIRGEYVYDTQDLPPKVLGHNAKVCLCKK